LPREWLTTVAEEDDVAIMVSDQDSDDNEFDPDVFDGSEYDYGDDFGASSDVDMDDADADTEPVAKLCPAVRFIHHGTFLYQDDAALKRMRDFYSRAINRDCATCGKSLTGTPFLMVPFVRPIPCTFHAQNENMDLFRSKVGMNIFAMCLCRNKTCRACGKAAFDKDDHRDPTEHCAEARAIAVYHILRAFDDLWYPESEDRATPAKTKAAPMYIQAEREASRQAPTGIGYGGQYEQDRAGTKKESAGAHQKTIMRKQEKLDRQMTALLACLDEFLPNGDSTTGMYQLMPAPVLPALLRHSSLLRGPSPLMLTLLRNDSLLDIAQRAELFLKMLAIIKAMVRHECFVGFVADALDKYENRRVIRSVFTGTTVEIKKDPDQHQALMTTMSDLIIQVCVLDDGF
jgi:hypothetical protein